MLPTYHRHSDGAAIVSPGKGVRRSREKFILLMIFVAFVFVCFGAFYYVPDLKESYTKLLDGQDNNNQHQIAIPPPNANKKSLRFPPVVNHNKEDSLNQHNSQENEEIRKEQANEDIKKDEEGDNDKKNNINDKDTAKKNEVQNKESLEVKKKRDFIKKMMQHAWNGYVKYAWGSNELRPSSLSSHSASIFGSSMGATIIDAMDTLHIMKMDNEFKKARDWIADNLKFQGGGEASVFEITIRFVGGLLSAYALTKDDMFKNKAEDLADKLMPAFNTRTGIPRATINLASGGSRNWGWAAGGASILAEIGTLHLEFAYLSKVTGKEKYVQAVERVRNHLQKIDKPNGLYPVYINPDSGNWAQHTVTLGALGDSFYEYLIKSYIMSGKKDKAVKKMYYDVIESIKTHMVKKSPSQDLTYLAELHGGHPSSKMDHLACFAGGMFALGGHNHDDATKGKEQVRLGAEITNSCHESYIRSATRIGPEAFHFDQGNEARALYGNEKYYILRPETVESYFVLWRITHDPKYREWGWDAAQAIEKHCKAAAGYSGIRDVYTVPAQQDDVQQSFFLAETLKYLYLLFSDDDVIPLDKWVFNTEAHPLPVNA